jgi:Zn-dependent M28 family amino/carboxypeptidase
VDDPPRPLESVEAMLNLDMVGRLKDDKLMVMGVGNIKPPRIPRLMGQAALPGFFMLTTAISSDRRTASFPANRPLGSTFFNWIVISSVLV